MNKTHPFIIVSPDELYDFSKEIPRQVEIKSHQPFFELLSNQNEIFHRFRLFSSCIK